MKAALILLFLAFPAEAQTIVRARLIEPTTRYGHHPMGPTVADHGALDLVLSDGSRRTIRLPESRVFEDNAARLADLTGDDAPEVVLVESDLERGARLSVYGPAGLVAAGPFIGQRNRWMAVAGIADLDGDGTPEIAVVDRPHLRRTLVIWQQRGSELVPVAELAGVTNHRFGEATIGGGIRTCADGSEVIVASPDLSQTLAVTFDGVALRARPVAGTMATAMGCRQP
ncbi:MAG: VCBS repeat-containing protein [Rhodobacteraceae bacterium]|nr:VCBS repeat-containing protein [Paracoccaceae bacterium]